MSWTLCTSGAAVAKAGANVNSVLPSISGATILSEWSDECEGHILSETRRDWITGYANTLSGAKLALADCCSDLVAMKMINYDMSGYTSRLEAQTMLDVLRDNAVKNLENLKDFKSNDIKSV